ncbi:DcaP family trimeric outer membrane transporter [Algoriphagus taiwanensis]|uniref:DcaP family trimeric outer membrane transporter n=1 Tax=Algoriphagus taiwanensis TaxID=1445656 RepID=A0ABQ6Q4U0_9BACT|nr:DcaP family trimeric outer membrane transporter [Algoriphagus taiwanensis]
MEIIKKTIVSTLIFGLGLSSIGLAQSEDRTDSIRKDSLNLIKKIVPEGDRKENNLLNTGTDLIDESFVGSWPMFGTDLRMKVGGYFKADFVGDFNGTLDNSQFLMSTIPVEGQPEYGNSGYVNFFAKESRFNIDVRRIEQGKVPLKLFIEGDFFNDETRFRLRHAYMVVGNFIFGQTWTTLSFLEAMPNMIDFAAGDALYGGRTVQVRYQKKVNEKILLAVGLEQLSFLGIENPDELVGKAIRKMPLLALRMDYSWKTGILFMGGSVAQLAWDGGLNGISPNALQINGAIAGRQYYSGKRGYFTFGMSYGQGAGENIIAFAGSNANAVLSANGLKTIPALSSSLGLNFKWTDQWASNIHYAYGWLETPADRDPFALKRGGIGHLNLIYNPIKRISTGLEYIWGAQRTTNDSFGRASRLQFMTKFEF